VSSAAKPARSVGRHMLDLLVLCVTAAAAWFMWPAFLGGSTQIIVVQGHSMEPKYHTGDLLVLDASVTPEVGSIIVFRIPASEPGGGHLVVHRVIGRRADGTYITQGDNTQNPDAFLTARADILGSPRFSVPHGGQAIGLLSTPMGLAAVTGLLGFALMWPRKRPAEMFAFIRPTIDDEGWSSVPISEQDMAVANLWLQSQISFG